jgi:hypothetical protein
LSQFGKNESDRTANLWVKFEDGSQRRFKPLVLGRVRAELPSFFKEQGAFPNNPTGWEVSCHGPWLPLIASEHLRFARNWQIDWQIVEVFQARVAFMAWGSFCSFLVFGTGGLQIVLQVDHELFNTIDEPRFLRIWQ